MAPASNDFDLDSFIEQQSNDDDVSYLQGLNGSLEDILNDSEVESYSEGFDDETAKPFLFRNPSFTRQRRKNDENNAVWAEKSSKKLEKVEGHSSWFSITDRLKIGYEKGTFLEHLEPYILKDMLGCLPPEVCKHLWNTIEKRVGCNELSNVFSTWTLVPLTSIRW